MGSHATPPMSVMIISKMIMGQLLLIERSICLTISQHPVGKITQWRGVMKMPIGLKTDTFVVWMELSPCNKTGELSSPVCC